MRQQDAWCCALADCSVNQLAIGRRYFQAVLAQQLSDAGHFMETRVVKQFAHHGRADGKTSLGIEVHLVDGSAGGKDGDLHRVYIASRCQARERQRNSIAAATINT